MNWKIDRLSTVIVSGIVAVFLIFAAELYGAPDPKTIDAAKTEGELNLWTTSDLRQVTRLAKRFEEKYPFLKVNIFRTGTVSLHNKIITEALAGQHSWDVSNSILHTLDLIQRGLIGKYKSPEADMLLDAKMMDEEGHWTAIYAVPFVLGYNTKLVKAAEIPKTYEELLRPKWRGQKISIDNQGYEVLQGLSIAWGKEKAETYLRKLAAQNPVPRRGNSLRVQLVVAGEFPVLMAMASPIQRATRKGAPIDWTPLEPVPVTFMSIMLAANAAHPNAGKLYIDFVLSQEGQEILRDVQRIPVRKDVEPDPPRLIRGYERVMLHPMTAKEYDEMVKLYKDIFAVR